MAFSILCIGLGEGGGKVAASMVEVGGNVGAINTNAEDLQSLSSIQESKKLLLKISGGGSGKEPNFVRESLKRPDLRNDVYEFINKLLNTTPIYTYCSACHSKNKLLDSEAIGMTKVCSECRNTFGITEVIREDKPRHDYIFLFACLGGGSGSGLIIDVIDICQQNFNIPIGVVCTVPDDMEDSVTKRNAVSVFRELYNTYARSGMISPFMLVDNQKMVEVYNLPLGSMYPTINRTITRAIDKFNGFSNKVSKYMSTIDTMDTARLWSLGGCCTLGKFIVGKSALPHNQKEMTISSPMDLGMIEDAIRQCTFVDGFDLASAKGVGIIAVAPEHYLMDQNVSNCIRYAFGKAKELIGEDALVFRGQFDDQNVDCLEFYIFFNGLSFPEDRLARLWNDVKKGIVEAKRKSERIDEVSYDIGFQPPATHNNFVKLQQNNLHPELQKEKPAVQISKAQVSKGPCNNCFIDPMSKKSTGLYNSKGPRPFKGICPLCQGSGKL